jgi:hypothetical protein
VVARLQLRRPAASGAWAAGRRRRRAVVARRLLRLLLLVLLVLLVLQRKLCKRELTSPVRVLPVRGVNGGRCVELRMTKLVLQSSVRRRTRAQERCVARPLDEPLHGGERGQSVEVGSGRLRGGW